MDVDSVAGELYSVPPGQFVAARDARVKEARAAGDREAARAIAAFRRPTVVAWLANLLTRRRPDDVAPLLGLGDALREATATLSGPELRQLSRQRHQLVHALVQTARALAEDAGQRVGEDSARGLEETLHAALADPSAAEQLLTGRLTEGLRHAGYTEPASGTAPARPATKKAELPSAGSQPATTTAEDERRAARRARIERDLGEAWSEARSTAEARAAAEDQAREADKRRADASREVRRLRDELARAEQALADAERERDHAGRARDRAEKEAHRARQRVTDLQARLDQL